MPHIQPNISTFARIKVIGVGGSGQNAVDHMIRSKIDGIDYVCINTDTQHLHSSLAPKKIHIGKNLTKGAGSGMNPEIGKKAVEETRADIQESLKDADMIFIACGMGGGTGTGAAPIVAKLAKEQGILTVGVVTRPFSFEGEQRSELARRGIEDLQKEVDALIVISNDRLLAITDRNTSFRQAFAMCDDVLLQAVKSIADIIREKQTVNIDLADVRAVLSNAGSAFIGIGISSGENRAEEAAERAINSPLLDVSISGAKGVLLSICTHSDDLKIFEVDEIARIVGQNIDTNARFIFGPVEDDTVKKGELKVTVVATGFDQKYSSPANTKSSTRSSVNPFSGNYNGQQNAQLAKTETSNPEILQPDFTRRTPEVKQMSKDEEPAQPINTQQQTQQPQPQKPKIEEIDDSDNSDPGSFWGPDGFSFIKRNK